MEVPTSAPRSRRRTAAGRRAQRKRAEGRVAMRLMACFQEVLRHRGGQLTMLGAALSQALKELEAPAPVSRSDAAERAPASSTDAAECVMQVDEGTGLDAQPASSGGVAGCDGDLFTEEAGEELPSEPLSEGTVVRIVGLQKRWELNSRTGRLLGPREFDRRVPVLVQELLLGGVVIAKEERVRLKVDNIMVLNGDG